MSNGLDPDEEQCSVGATDLLICKYVKTDLWIYMYVYLNAKVSQPFNICIFFSMVHVRILI